MGIKIGQAKEIEMEEAVAFLREHDPVSYTHLTLPTNSRV